MGIIQNVSMTLSGRKSHWAKTNHAAVEELSAFFKHHFASEYPLQTMFVHYLYASAIVSGELIYQGNPSRSFYRVDIKNISKKEMIDLHKMGVQLFGTMFTDINRKTLQLNTLHLIFNNVFPDIGIIDQIANSYGKEKFDIAPYASAYHDQTCSIFNIESTSPIDWVQIPPILVHAIGVVTPNIKESLQ